MEFVHGIFQRSPEIALFLSLAVGYRLGKISFGRFQLGGVAGSLLVAVLLSQFGVEVDPGVKSVLFALFIYAVGFESGPQFFSSLGLQSVKEIVLAIVLAVTGLATVVVLAKIFEIDKGLAAGIAAGGLTQSAIIGTASDAIAKMALPAEEIKRLQSNVAIGYAVTYVFGSFGAIIVCVNILPKFMGRSIRDDAAKAEAAMYAGRPMLGPGQQSATPDLVGRLFQVEQAAGKTVAEIEALHPVDTVTIERLQRAGTVVEIDPGLTLQRGDVVLVVGRRAAMVAAAAALGSELQQKSGMELVLQNHEVVLTNRAYDNKTIGEIRAGASPGLRHGVYVPSITRMGKPLPMTPETPVHVGDVVTLYGAEQDVKRVTAEIGNLLVPSDKTDFVYLGLGLVAGLLVGLLTVRIGSIPLTLGSGGGALLSGLLFGWYRARRQSFGNLPPAAVQLLKDLGLAGFVVVVGLSSGLQAVETVKASGLSVFLIGVVVTVLPLLITMVIGRYVLRYDNTAIFAGALSGSRSANPAFGEVLAKAENAIPTVPFAITYALANVFLTLLGPLIVALV